eukprot:TRINITY_DN102924_c0_g1_i1.p1 TRINITY_DN102924_c0_g1~~TRINITY_DN102924_c0_g1_i1.p1  ORF type:complete len:709 (+),score=295.74 TRINITY_DN102924_c0_g1_i1:98-2224(+)
MHRLRSLLVLPAVAVAASTEGSGIASQDSLGRVQVTLQSLLRNIQDTGRHAEKALKQRHQWCEAAASSFASKEEAIKTDLEHLRLDLLEQEAALEEAEGSLRERHAEVAMLQHTINMTAAVLQDTKLNASLATSTSAFQAKQHDEAEKRLGALLESRVETATSLEGEVSALKPYVSQLQAQVAEARRQITDRTGSSKAQRDFGDAIRERCEGSLRNADKQASLRVAEAGAISKALQALEQLGVTPQAAQQDKQKTDDAALAQGLAEVSFMQLKSRRAKAASGSDSSASSESGEEALFSLFGDDMTSSDATPAAAAASDSSSTESDDTASASSDGVWESATSAIAQFPEGTGSQAATTAASAAAAEASDSDDSEAEEAIAEANANRAPAPRMAKAANAPGDAVANVEHLLASLHADHEADGGRRAWCSQERSRNQQRLQLAQDASQRASGEAQMHEDMQAQLQEGLDRLQSEKNEIAASAQEVANDTSKEFAMMDAGVKDEELATKILQQASKFLQESEAAGGQALQAYSNQAVQAAIEELAKAKKLFKAQVKFGHEAKKDVGKRISAVAAAAKQAKAALEKESSGLILARDASAALLRRSKEESVSREAEAVELKKYIDGLGKSCEAAGNDNAGAKKESSPEERQRAAEMQVLEDARKVLKGEKLAGQGRFGAVGGSLRGAPKAAVDPSKLSPLEQAAMEMGLAPDGN